MSRAGRRRKQGKRYPSGGLVPEKKPDDMVRAGRQPHRRELPVDDRTDPIGESPIGRMLLMGQLLTPAEQQQHLTARGHIDLEACADDSRARARYEAGLHYARAVGKYRSVIETPRATAGAGSGLPCLAGDPIEKQVRIGGLVLTVRDWACAGDCVCARRKASYDAAFETVMAAGQVAAKVVARLAVHGEAIAEQDRVYLANGLDALAKHFGLTGGRRRAHS